jgi:iron complex transport system ATP-binding protein
MSAKSRFPELLLLDEPTSALDPKWQLVVISEGSLIAFGPPKTIMSPEVISRAYRISARIEYCSGGIPFVLVDYAAL